MTSEAAVSMSTADDVSLGSDREEVPASLPPEDAGLAHSGLFEDLPDVWPSGCGEPGLLEACSAACQDATSQLGPVRCASVTALFDARPVTVAVTELRALLLDHAQYRENEGPALEAVRSGTRVWVSAGPRPPRWGGVRLVADALSVKWVAALPVRAADNWAGSLNLYGTEPLERPELLDPEILQRLVDSLQQAFEQYVLDEPPG
jgi:hypothetical protein